MNTVPGNTSVDKIPQPPPLPPPFKIQPTNYNLNYFNCEFCIMQRNDNITNAMWNSGHILLKYLEQSNNDYITEITNVIASKDTTSDMNKALEKYSMSDTVILELGAGVGHVGIAISLGLQPKEYIFTDYQTDEIRKNVIENMVMCDDKFDGDQNKFTCGNTKVNIVNVDWKHSPEICYNDSSVPDVLLCIDCVWIADLYIPLLNHILYLSELNPNLIIILAHEHRQQDSYKDFFKVLIDNNMIVRKIYDEDLVAKSPIVGLFLICKTKCDDKTRLME